MAEQQLQWARQALADSEGLPAYLIENIKREIKRLQCALCHKAHGRTDGANVCHECSANIPF